MGKEVIRVTYTGEKSMTPEQVSEKLIEHIPSLVSVKRPRHGNEHDYDLTLSNENGVSVKRDVVLAMASMMDFQITEEQP